jgi:hypothetical protein
MPDSIRHPEVPRILFHGFRLYGRNDKSPGDNVKLASPKGEGFQSSPCDQLHVLLPKEVMQARVFDRVTKFSMLKTSALYPGSIPQTSSA